MSQLARDNAEWFVLPPAGAPFMELRFMSQLDEMKKLIADQATENIKKTDAMEIQINKLNTHTFYPLCLRRLCEQAAELINDRDGNKHGSGIIRPKLDAPTWAKQWLVDSDVILEEQDLKVIYSTVPGSTRGDANKAAHEVPQEDQAAAVRAVKDVIERQSLSRIFFFVYNHPVE
jgi:hypothetical protein